jgi:hypothetical protein
MITLITTWVTEKIVAVITVTVVAVAAVPTTLILTTEHQVTVTVTQQQQQTRLVLIQTVKTAGDELIVKLQNAEDSCDTQVTGIATSSKAKTARLDRHLSQAKVTIHGAVSPFVTAIQKDEEHFQQLAVITPEDEQNELAHLQLIELESLGDGETTGVVVVTCTIVIVEIKIIVVEVEHNFGGDQD